MKSGWNYYRDIDGSEVKHAPKTLVGNVYVQEAETEGLQSLLDAKLQNAANVIQTTHIADGAVVGAKLANAAVTSGKIASEAIRDEHIPVAQISPTKIANLAETILTTVQEKLAQVTSGAMAENELYRQVVMAVKTAIENSGIEGTVEDALRDQIVSIARNALQAGIETSSLTATRITAAQADMSELEAAHLSAVNLEAFNAAINNTLHAATIDATSGKFEHAAITDLDVHMVEAESLLTSAAVADVLTAGELILSDDSGEKLFRLQVADDGTVKAVEGVIDGDAIADASLPGKKIALKSILAAHIDVGDLFASEAFIGKLKTYLIESENLDVIIDQADDLFAKIKTFFHFEKGLDIYQENSADMMHLDGDELTFRHNGSIVADINNGQMNIPNAFVSSTLALGKHKWDVEVDGSLSLVWNGV